MVKKLLPALVALMAQVDVDERIVFRLDRFFDKPHTGLLRVSAAFFHITSHAGTNNIPPNRFAAHTPGDNVIKRQFAGRIPVAAILTNISVASVDVPAIESYFITRKSIIKQQPNNARHRDRKIHSRDPIVTIGFKVVSELAYLAPALEIVVGIRAGFKRNYFGKLAT